MADNGRFLVVPKFFHKVGWRKTSVRLENEEDSSVRLEKEEESSARLEDEEDQASVHFFREK